LLPWLTVRQNICFPLKIKRLPKQICELKLEELLTDLPVQLPLTAKAGRLSGGQAQLTVLLRALIFQPKVLFLDEPFQRWITLQSGMLESFYTNKYTVRRSMHL
jgi:NitT/TauT family transport system ATP-binding protein